VNSKQGFSRCASVAQTTQDAGTLHLAAEAFARSHTSETTAEMAAVASSSWIESTNSKNTSRGDACNASWRRPPRLAHLDTQSARFGVSRETERIERCRHLSLTPPKSPPIGGLAFGSIYLSWAIGLPPICVLEGIDCLTFVFLRFGKRGNHCAIVWRRSDTLSHGILPRLRVSLANYATPGFNAPFLRA
jgi:hypothetical protein